MSFNCCYMIFFLDEEIGKLEGDVFASEFLIDGGVSADFVLHLRLLRLVQKHFRRTRTIQLTRERESKG